MKTLSRNNQKCYPKKIFWIFLNMSHASLVVFACKHLKHGDVFGKPVCWYDETEFEPFDHINAAFV